MTSQLDWNSLQGVNQKQSAKASNEMDWDSLEKMPFYEPLKEREQEGLLKSTVRTAAQPLLGYAEATPYGIGTSALQAAGMGESFAEMQDWEDGREAELRKKFPQAPWPKENVFDKQKYLEATLAASKTVPTIDNLAKLAEETTGVPLEAKTTLQEKMRLGGSAAKFTQGSFLDKFIKGGVTAATSAGLQEAGVPKFWADTIGFAAPGMGSKIAGNKAQQEIIDFGRRKGLSEAQITKAIQSPTKTKWLSGLSKKNLKTQEQFEGARKAIGNIFQDLRGSKGATRPLSPIQQKNFMEKSAKILNDLPANQRNLLMQDARDLVTTGFTGDGLINFWQDITYQVAKGERGLGRLKGPIGDALNELSPQLGKDFKLTNEMYGNVAKLQKFMTPKLQDQVLKGTKAYAVVNSLMTGNFKALGSTLRNLTGIESIQRLAKNLLTNPRYQNLTKQMIKSLSENKINIAMNLKKNLANRLEKEDEDVAKEIRELEF